MMNPSVSRKGRTGRWITVAIALGLFVTVGFQWRSIHRLREENNALRAQAQGASPQIPSPRASPAASDIEPEQIQKDRRELVSLRNEVRQLREQVALRTVDVQPKASQSAPVIQSVGDEVRELAIAAMRGNTSALEKLIQRVADTYTMNPDERTAVLSGIHSAFDLLGTAAGQGDRAALQALWHASRIPSLEGFAAQGLGRAAALGNEEALDPLVGPEAYHLLRSSAVAALKPAAEAGNQRAIEALTATAADPKQEALWLLAAQGLEKAAAAGNATAIDGLAKIATATNQVISKEAILALEAAARQRHPQAEEALRKLGWR